MMGTGTWDAERRKKKSGKNGQQVDTEEQHRKLNRNRPQ
jgi:hypothetical protein